MEDKYAKDRKYHKVWDHCHYKGEYRGAEHSICKLKFSIHKEITMMILTDLTMIIFLS